MNSDFDKLLKAKAMSESIVVPDSIDNIIESTMSNISVIKPKKFKNIFKLVASFTVILLISAACVFKTQVIALPIINSAFKLLNENNMINKEYISLSNINEVSQTSNGITVTIDSLTYDGYELAIGAVVTSKEGFEDNSIFLEESSLKINGQQKDFGAGSKGYFKDKNTYVTFINYNFRKNIMMPDYFTLDLNIDKVKTLDKEIEGNWNYKFKVDKIKEIKIGKDIPKDTMKNISKEGYIESVAITPLNTVINFKNYNLGKTDNLVGIDDKGNIIRFKGEHSTSRFSGERNSTDFFTSASKDSKWIKFTPFYTQEESFNKDIENKKATLSSNGYAKVDLGSWGSVEVLNIEDNDEFSYVTYKYNGFLKFEPKKFSIDNIERDDGLRLCEYYESKDLGDGVYKSKVKKMNDKTKYQIDIFDVEKFYKIREDLSFTVNLNK